MGVSSVVPITPTVLARTTSANQSDMPSRNRRSSDSVRKHNAVVCHFFQAGYCRRGHSCPFSHQCSRQQQWNGLQSTHKNKSQFPVTIHDNGFSPEQPPPYYPSTLPFYLWSPPPPPPPCTVPVPSCPHDSPRLGTIGTVDYYALTSDNRRDDSEVVSTAVFDRDVCSALEAMNLNNHNLSSGSPVLSNNPISSYRPGLAAAPYRDPTSVPGALLSPDWISYLASANAANNNADCWYGSPSFFAQSYVAAYQDELKRKPFSYRTKPCRFFAATGKCSSGDKCTFIHDAETRKTQQPNSHTIPDGSNATSHILDKSSKRDDSKPENFYPITWRVIGGGVMMSGERKICDAFVAGHCQYGDDCKFAHETDIEMDRKPWRRLLQYRPETPNTTPSLTENGYLKLTPADRDGVRRSGAGERFGSRGSAQVQVQVQVQTPPDRIISRPKITRARPTIPPEPSSTELPLDVGSREKRTALYLLPGDEILEDARQCSKGGDDDTGARLRHPTGSTCLPHRRTRSMVGLVSPLSSTIVPATTPANFSAEF